MLEIGRSNWARSDCGRKKHVAIESLRVGLDVEDHQFVVAAFCHLLFPSDGGGGPGHGPG